MRPLYHVSQNRLDSSGGKELERGKGRAELVQAGQQWREKNWSGGREGQIARTGWTAVGRVGWASARRRFAVQQRTAQHKFQFANQFND